MAEATIKFEMDTTECQKLINDARKELKEKYSWKPIKTAPKNFSDVLLYLPESEEGDYGNRVTIGYWEVDEKCWIIPGLLSNELANPTHWMRLPEIP